jgi:endonuclease III
VNEALTDSLLALAMDLEKAHGAPGQDASLGVTDAGEEALLHQFAFSMLLWESTPALAVAALEALRAEVTCLNELRVCSVEEVAAVLPRETPLLIERADRLITGLNQIFQRENALTLRQLNALGKREARQYLDALEGVPQFVAARVTLLGLGGHSFPVDERVAALLREHGVIEDDGANAHAVAQRVERAVRAADAARVYALFESAAAAHAAEPRRRTRRKSPASAESQPDAAPGPETHA